MAIPVFTPRVNNNDDTVRVARFHSRVGDAVATGDTIAEVETDKAVFSVEAESSGYMLGFMAAEGDTVDVGTVLAWLGASADEPLPTDIGVEALGSASAARDVSLKAAILLAQHGLDAAQVLAAGEQLTAADVLRHVQKNGTTRAPKSRSAVAEYPPPAATGQSSPLTSTQRAMLRTVEWQKLEAVPGYVEISYDASLWSGYAAEFQKSHALLTSPLLALLAWRVALVARAIPAINTTVHDGQRYTYDNVNLGFTVQAGEQLYITVLRDAQNLDEVAFVRRLSELQRGAMKHALKPEETSGATVTFTSMARWPVTRHTPVLPPHTSFIVAHSAADANGEAHLGATYDHRILSGADAVRALMLCRDPQEIPA